LSWIGRGQIPQEVMAIRGKKKSPPFLSQEFIIQNHGDIVSCLCMVVMVGLMFQATQPYAQVFIAAQHNVTKTTEETEETIVNYTAGGKDAFTIFFYSLCWIVVHAIIQEYILDRFNKRLHLSKTKNTKFNDSGVLLPFFIASIVVAVELINREKTLTNFSKLWEDYPATEMTFLMKFYYILQIAFWVHCFPELYFTKAKRDEISEKVTHYVLYLIFISAAYLMSGSKIGIVLLLIHYIPEALYHATRLFHCAGKSDMARHGFLLWAVFFVLARLATIVLTIFIVWFGLGKSEIPYIDFPSRNCNTRAIRITVIAAMILNQAWIGWNFIMFQMRRYRESCADASAALNRRIRNEKDKERKKEKKSKKREDEVHENGSPRMKSD